MYGLRHHRVTSGPGEACAWREPFLLDCTYYKPTPLKWLLRMQHHSCGFALAYVLLNSTNIDRTRPLRTVEQTCLGAHRAKTKKRWDSLLGWKQTCWPGHPNLPYVIAWTHGHPGGPELWEPSWPQNGSRVPMWLLCQAKERRDGMSWRKLTCWHGHPNLP